VKTVKSYDVWTVDNVVRSIEIYEKNFYLLIYWAFLPSVACDPERWKNRSITQLYKTIFIYRLYEYSKRFVQPVVQPVVQPWASAHRGKWGQLTPWKNG